MKLHLFIRDPEDFLAGNHDNCFSVVKDLELWQRLAPEWIYTGPIDVEIDVDRQEVRQIAISAMDEKIKEIRAGSEVAINEIKERKQKLLAIEQHTTYDD